MKRSTLKGILAVSVLGGIQSGAQAEEFKKFIECDHGDTWVDRWYANNESPVGYQLVIANDAITDYFADQSLIFLNHKREAIVKSQNFTNEDAFSAIVIFDSYQTPRNQPQVYEFSIQLSKADDSVKVKFDIYEGYSMSGGTLEKGKRIGGWHYNNCRRAEVH